MNIIESVKNLIEMKEHLETVRKYCLDDFYASETYKRHRSVHHGTWCAFKDYEIVDEARLKVFYEYGYGEYEYSGSYVIHLGEEYRDKRIADILSNE